MKNDPKVIVSLSMRDSLKKAVAAKAEQTYGPRQFSTHVCNVLATDLAQKPRKRK